MSENSGENTPKTKMVFDMFPVIGHQFGVSIEGDTMEILMNVWKHLETIRDNVVMTPNKQVISETC